MMILQKWPQIKPVALVVGWLAVCTATAFAIAVGYYALASSGGFDFDVTPPPSAPEKSSAKPVSISDIEKKIKTKGLIWMKDKFTVDLGKGPAMYCTGMILAPYTKTDWQASASVDLVLPHVSQFEDGGVKFMGKTHALNKEFSDYAVTRNLRYYEGHRTLETTGSPCPVYIDTYTGLRAYTNVVDVWTMAVRDKHGTPLVSLTGRGYVDRAEAIQIQFPKSSVLEIEYVSIVVAHGEHEVPHFPPLVIEGETFPAVALPLEGFNLTLGMIEPDDEKELAKYQVLWELEKIPPEIQQRAAIWCKNLPKDKIEPVIYKGWSGVHLGLNGGKEIPLNQPKAFTGKEVAGKKMVIGTHFAHVGPVSFSPAWTVWVNITARAK